MLGEVHHVHFHQTVPNFTAFQSRSERISETVKGQSSGGQKVTRFLYTLLWNTRGWSEGELFKDDHHSSRWCNRDYVSVSITGKTLERDAILNFHFLFVSNASSANPPPFLDYLRGGHYFKCYGITVSGVWFQLVMVVNKLMLVKKLSNWTLDPQVDICFYLNYYQ